MVYRVIRPLRSHRRGDLVAPSSSSHHIPQSSGSKSIELQFRRFRNPGHPWGLRPGPIQAGSQSGPRLDRKARARKDPKAHGRFMANQACTTSISLQEYTSHSSIREKWRRDTSARPHIAARTRAELGSRLTQPRRSPHALGSAAQQCAGAPQWSDGGGWTRFCEQ